LAAAVFDPVLLVGGALAGEGEPRIEAQVRDGDECLVLHGGAEVKPADDAAFVAHIMERDDGAGAAAFLLTSEARNSGVSRVGTGKAA
jgi:hypothetical protein